MTFQKSVDTALKHVEIIKEKLYSNRVPRKGSWLLFLRKEQEELEVEESLSPCWHHYQDGITFMSNNLV